MSIPSLSFYVFVDCKYIREVWEHITGAIENFWIIFQKDYLTLLRKKHMLSHPSPRGSLAIRPTVGQVVLVKEHVEPRGSWKLGRILHLDSREAVILSVRQN